MALHVTSSGSAQHLLPQSQQCMHAFHMVPEKLMKAKAGFNESRSSSRLGNHCPLCYSTTSLRGLVEQRMRACLSLRKCQSPLSWYATK